MSLKANPDSGLPERGSATVVRGQAIRFLFIGIAATLVHFVVATTIVWAAGTGALIANTGGYCVALFVSYFGHAMVSFKTAVNRNSFCRFAVINSSLFLIAAGVSWSADRLAVNPYLGVFITVCILPPVSFLIHKFVTFRV